MKHGCAWHLPKQEFTGALLLISVVAAQAIDTLVSKSRDSPYLIVSGLASQSQCIHALT
jgi:hypothetical protein